MWSQLVARSGAPLLLGQLFLLAACTDQVEYLQARPKLEPLPIESRVRGDDNFPIGSLVRLPSCHLVAVGARWGSVVHLDPNGELLSRPVSPPVPVAGARLEPHGPDQVILWNEKPPLLAVYSLRLQSFRMVEVPHHPWGGTVRGVVSQSDSVISITAMGEGETLESDSKVSAPVFMSISEGSVVERTGTVRGSRGRFLDWYYAKGVVGAFGDSLAILRSHTGELDIYHRGADMPARTIELPRYIVGPSPVERVWDAGWIDEGGTVAFIEALPQVIAGAIHSGGKSYAVRPYAASMATSRNRMLGRVEIWTATESGLEIYERSGRRLGAYALPAPDPSWLSVGPDGRLFIGYGSGLVEIALDPTFDGERRCEPLPGEMQLRLKDLEPPR